MNLHHVNEWFRTWIFTVGAMDRNPALYDCPTRRRIREECRQEYVSALMEAKLEGLK